MYGLGVSNIACIGQGKLSLNHLDGLKQFKVKYVTIIFDNDSVGAGNMETALNVLLDNTDIIPYVLDPKYLAPHKDPDEYIRAYGIDAFKSLLKKREKSVHWLSNKIVFEIDTLDSLEKEKIKNSLLELSTAVKDPEDLTYIKNILVEKFQLEKADVNSLVKDYKEKERINKYKKLKNDDLNKSKRYFPFIEKNTSAYAYLDSNADSVYLGVSREILSNILLSAEQTLPDIFPVLKADFDVTIDERI